ncbi:MAG: polyphosphate polymerase domain-containing protein [Anaerolineaceae bacterium]
MRNPSNQTLPTRLSTLEDETLSFPILQQVSPNQVQLAFMAANFKSINLNEMDSVALLDRVDTKFGMTVSQLVAFLPELRGDYRMLNIQGQRMQKYHTLYFDTAGFDLFNLHINERADQYKVRIREYASTNQAFLEVKHKTKKGRTVKNRVVLDGAMPILGKDEMDWLSGYLPQPYLELEPTLMNTFTRVVLVDKSLTERITLDIAINFSSGWNVISADQVVVAEVKQNNPHQPSHFLERMHHSHLRPTGFSKYCIGVSLLYDQVKINPLKSKLLWMEKVNGGN